MERAVRIPGDVALLRAVGNRRREGVRSRYVGELRGGGSGQFVRRAGTHHHVADDFGRRAAGQSAGGTKGSAAIAAHNLQSGDDIHSLFVQDVVVVRVSRAGLDYGGARAAAQEGEHREHHRQRQHQGKELLHVSLPPCCICPRLYAAQLCAAYKRTYAEVHGYICRFSLPRHYPGGCFQSRPVPDSILRGRSPVPSRGRERRQMFSTVRIVTDFFSLFKGVWADVIQL